MRKMKKIRLLGLLLVCVFIISSCSGNNLPVSRKLNSKDDTIKFYNFDWLTELNVIKNKFNQDFSAKPFVVEPFESNGNEIINEKLGEYSFYINGKDRIDLDWDIAGNALSYIELNFVSSDGGKTCYLYGATYNFVDNTSKPIGEDLIGKLDGLYEKQSEENKDGIITAIYKDKNDNTAVLKSYSGSGHITITYVCEEVKNILNELHYVYFMNKEENDNNTNGL